MSQKKSTETNRKHKHDDPEQSKRFLKAARDAEADETIHAADNAFTRVKKLLKGKKRGR
ncbi:MAG: hypothetical protein J0I29_12610 [Rhizobiales bacterium]|nr:hypothetical protein [Hyphomicrobiales bacterium]